MRTWQLDHSQLSRFLQCPERYRFQYEERLVKTDGTDALPLTFGQAVHEQIATWLRREQPRLLQWTDVPGETLYTQEHLRQLMDAYRQQYASDLDEYTVKAVETTLTLTLAPEVPPYTVKTDAVLENASGVWGKETKTTARKGGLGDTFWQPYEMDAQITGEFAAVEAAYGQCAGIILDAIWFGVRQRATERGPAGFFVECERQVFNRSPEQVENWKVRTARTMRRLIETVETGRYEQHTKECIWCPYQPLCLSNDAPGVREAMYVVTNPLAYLEEREAP